MIKYFAKPLFSYLIASCLFASCFIVSQADAADPFTVTGVAVDANGETAIEAQTLAISDGQLRAANILIERLTLETQRQQSTNLEVNQEDAAKLIRALEISNEKRSGSRYLGDITVAFNPIAVQSYLRSRDVQMISTQARPRLVLPVLSGTSLWTENAWLSAWRGDTFSHALTPVKSFAAKNGNDALISAAQAVSGDMQALQKVGQKFGVTQILVAEVSYRTGQPSAIVTDISIESGQRREFGEISGESYSLLAKKIVTTLENDWKNASISVAGKAVSTAATIRFRSHSEWQSLQDSINGSAQIQDARLDALSKDGALMTLTYGGDFARLKNELSFKGVDIKQDPDMGLVLFKTGRY